MRCAAIVPHWNRRDLLDTALRSFREQAFDEVIVADNGSTDDSAALAKNAGARVLRLGRNLGFAAAVNRGVAATTARWVAILNNDVTLDHGWLEALLENAERQAAWFATGKILRAGNPCLIDATFDEISRAAMPWRCGCDRSDAPIWNEPRQIRCAPMTAAIFRRDLFDEIGPLDELFGSYLEDVDFGLRCAAAGRHGVYVPAAVAHHVGSATLGSWNKDTVVLAARNQILLARKHLRGTPVYPILAGQLLWGLNAILRGRGWSFLKGKLRGLRDARALKVNGSKESLYSIADASEQSILELQRQAGFDRYWRAYFWLVWRR